MQKSASLLLAALAAIAAAGPDLSPTESLAPRFNVRPGWQIPTIRVSNLGDSPAEDFLVVCRIDSFNLAVYQCTTHVTGPLLPGHDSAFRFPPRTLVHWYSDYDVRFWTVLAGDSEPRNDSAITATEVTDWNMSDTLIECPGSGATVDGRIGYDEYHGDPSTDVSDRLGRGGLVPVEPGACLLYVCQNFSYTYLGFDFRRVLRRTDGDSIRIWMDENYDGSFGPAGDSSEGYHTVFVRGGVDSVTYWLKPGEQCPGCTSASSTQNGNLQMELRVPFGQRPGDYSVDPNGDVAGIGIQAKLAEIGGMAWWPQRIQPGQMHDPAYYGAFEWIEIVCIDEQSGGAMLKAGPSTIIRGVLFLPPSLLSPPFSLLSVDGRKVLDLHAGANDVSRLSPGVYFVRGEAQAQAQAVRKVVVTR